MLNLNLECSILYEISTNALLLEEKFKSEKKAVLDEIHNSDNSPYRKYTDTWNRTRYSKETPIMRILGKKSHIRSTTLDDLKHWYKEIFYPNNMTLTIVGNVTHEVAHSMAEKYFGQLNGTKKTLADMPFKDLQISDREIKILVDENEKQTLNSISFPSVTMMSNSHKDRQIVAIIANLLANYQNSPLYTKLRKQTGLLYSIGADNLTGENSGGVFEITFETSEKKLVDVYKIVMDEIVRIKEQGFTENELKHAIERGCNSLKMGYQSVSNIVWWVAPQLHWHEEVLSYEDFIKIKHSITLDDVNAMIKKVFDFGKMNVISRVNTDTTAKDIKALYRKQYL